MYAAIRKGQAQPGKSQEIATRIEEDLIGKIRQIPGFIAYYVVHTGEDEITSISIFEDEAGADQSTTLARAWVAAEVSTIMVGGLGTSEGQVLAYAGR